jgi:hypothetical protein
LPRRDASRALFFGKLQNHHAAQIGDKLIHGLCAEVSTLAMTDGHRALFRLGKRLQMVNATRVMRAIIFVPVSFWMAIYNHSSSIWNIKTPMVARCGQHSIDKCKPRSRRIRPEICTSSEGKDNISLSRATTLIQAASKSKSSGVQISKERLTLHPRPVFGYDWIIIECYSW